MVRNEGEGRRLEAGVLYGNDWFQEKNKEDKISFGDKLLTKPLRDADNSNDGNLFMQNL